MKGLGSWNVGDVQIHGQLPPPLVWYGPPLALTPSAFGEDWTGGNVRSDRLPANTNVFLHCLYSTLLQNILQPWILPHMQPQVYFINREPVFLGFFPPSLSDFSFLFLKFASKSYFSLPSSCSHLILTTIPLHWQARQSKSAIYNDRDNSKQI
jgi:hypothetical protein